MTQSVFNCAWVQGVEVAKHAVLCSVHKHVEAAVRIWSAPRKRLRRRATLRCRPFKWLNIFILHCSTLLLFKYAQSWVLLAGQ